MPLVNMKDMLQHAYDHGYAVGAFDLVSLEFLEGILAAAERARAPVILSLAESHFEYFDFELIMPAVEAAAKRASVPVAIHLDHGSCVEQCAKAIDVGFTSVMIDGSKLPIDENIAQTNEVVALAKSKGITVEAEVGELQILNPDGSMNEVENLSDPDDIKRISGETDIDMLAVGIGNAHGFYKGQPNIRIDLLEDFVAASSVPLVLHGTTGIADDTVRKCVSMGMAKVNLGTLIRTRFVEYTAQAIAKGEHQNHPWRVAQAAKDQLKEDVRYIVQVTDSAGKAKELPCQAR